MNTSLPLETIIETLTFIDKCLEQYTKSWLNNATSYKYPKSLDSLNHIQTRLSFIRSEVKTQGHLKWCFEQFNINIDDVLKVIKNR